MQIPGKESRASESVHGGFFSSKYVTERVQIDIGFLFRFWTMCCPSHR